jgi:hypothetical protein
MSYPRRDWRKRPTALTSSVLKPRRMKDPCSGYLRYGREEGGAEGGVQGQGETVWRSHGVGLTSPAEGNISRGMTTCLSPLTK